MKLKYIIIIIINCLILTICADMAPVYSTPTAVTFNAVLWKFAGNGKSFQWEFTQMGILCDSDRFQAQIS